MSKLLVAIVALSTLGFLAYNAMYKATPRANQLPTSAPKQQLDNVRNSVTKSMQLEQRRGTEMGNGALNESDQPATTPTP